jgi:hypothetical protein
MATQLGPSVQITAQDIFTTTTTQQHNLGEKAYTSDGRTYRYASVQPSAGGATGQPVGATLVTGNVLQSPANIPNHLALVPTQGQAVGDTTIIVTLGATAASANLYAGGYAIISTTPGVGYAYLIKSHAAVASAGVMTITLSDSIQVAITTTSRVDLQQNAYSGVIQSPITTTTGSIVGVANAPIPSSGAGITTYGWIQSRGVCAALNTGGTTLGSALAAANPAAAGAVYTAVNTNAFTLNIVGHAIGTGVTAKNNAVYLTLD